MRLEATEGVLFSEADHAGGGYRFGVGLLDGSAPLAALVVSAPARGLVLAVVLAGGGGMGFDNMDHGCNWVLPGV